MLVDCQIRLFSRFYEEGYWSITNKGEVLWMNQTSSRDGWGWIGQVVFPVTMDCDRISQNKNVYKYAILCYTEISVWEYWCRNENFSRLCTRKIKMTICTSHFYFELLFIIVYSYCIVILLLSFKQIFKELKGKYISQIVTSYPVRDENGTTRDTMYHQTHHKIES